MARRVRAAWSHSPPGCRSRKRCICCRWRAAASGYVRGTIDLGGRLDPSGDLFYRLAAPGFTSGMQDEHTRSDTITLKQQLLGHFDTGPLRHAVLIGANWQNLRDSYNSYAGSAPPIDIYAPDPDQAIPAPALSASRRVATNQEAVFAEDQISQGRPHLQIGGREDWSKIDTRDQLSSRAGFSQFDRAFTWRAGILYALPSGLSPYFNYALVRAGERVRLLRPSVQADAGRAV